MEYLKIANWDRWQTYRKDRGQPPWIKIHRSLMRNLEWIQLTDAERGQLVAIWLLAADHDGVIMASPKLIQKLCFTEKAPDLELFISLGFIEPGANVTPERRQGDAPEERREEKNREDKKDKIPPIIPPGGSTVVLKNQINQVFKTWEELPNLKKVPGPGTAARGKAVGIVGARLKEGRKLRDLNLVMKVYNELVGLGTAPGYNKWGLAELFGRDAGGWCDTLLDPDYQGITNGDRRREVADPIGTATEPVELFTEEERAEAERRRTR
jgi:hypothetical protein